MASTTVDSAPSRTYRFKVLLVGDKGVGKTAIFNYLSTQPDAPKTPRVTAATEVPTTPTGTKDSCYKDVVISGKTIRFQLWDYNFGSQPAPPSFYRGAAAVLFVCDILTPSTLISIDKWQKECRRHVTGFFNKVIIANKFDLTNLTAWNAVVAENEFYFHQLDAAFVLPVSAKSGMYLDNAFQELAQQILKYRNVPEYEEPIAEPVRNSTSCAKN